MSVSQLRVLQPLPQGHTGLQRLRGLCHPLGHQLRKEDRLSPGESLPSVSNVCILHMYVFPPSHYTCRSIASACGQWCLIPWNHTCLHLVLTTAQVCFSCTSHHHPLQKWEGELFPPLCSEAVVGQPAALYLHAPHKSQRVFCQVCRQEPPCLQLCR